MRHRVIIIAAFVGLMLFLVWFGGFLIFNRTVFGYVQMQAASGNAAESGGAEYAAAGDAAQKRRADCGEAQAYVRAMFDDGGKGRGILLPIASIGKRRRTAGALNRKPRPANLKTGPACRATGAENLKTGQVRQAPGPAKKTPCA